MKNMSYLKIKTVLSYIPQMLGFALKRLCNMKGDISIKPWGNYCIVLTDQKRCLVKKLVIRPKQRISYQSHELRNEHWIIICGNASVKLEEQNISLTKNDYIYIPKGKKHRIENLGSDDLIMIEVQTGEGFFENDIIRYEDDYNRS